MARHPGRSRNKSTFHLATNWALHYLLPVRWPAAAACHHPPREDIFRCVLWDETQRQYSVRPATNVRLQPYRAMKSTAHNWTRRYRKPKSPDIPSDSIRTQSFFRPERSVADRCCLSPILPVQLGLEGAFRLSDSLARCCFWRVPVGKRADYPWEKWKG